MNSGNIFSNDNILPFQICERCKASKANFKCLQCSPFHYFCSNCDTFLHSIQTKMIHNRISLDKNNMNDKKQNINNDYNYNSNNYNFSSTNDNTFKKGFLNKNYTEEYVNQLNNIHLKEKNELLFKIQSLEDSIIRLKNSFGEHINQVNKTIEENSKKANKKFEKLTDDNLYKKNLEEKDLEIKQLKDEIEKYKQLNNEMIYNLKEKDKEKNYNEEKMRNEINLLNNQIQLLKNVSLKKDTINMNNFQDLNKLRNEYEMRISKMKIDNDNKINEVKNENCKQIECANYELAKLRNENISLTRQYNDLERESLLNDKKNKEEIQSLKNELEYIKEENSKNIAKLQNSEKNFINLQSQNIGTMNSLNRQKEELKNYQNEILVLKNNIDSLRESNDLLNKKNKELQNDYIQLCSHTENMNFEYNKKLKNLSYIQDEKNQLEFENNTLRNNMNKFMRPYSFY